MDEEQVDPSVLYGAIQDQQASAERSWKALCRVADRIFWMWIMFVLPILAAYEYLSLYPPHQVSQLKATILQVVGALALMVPTYLTTSRIRDHYLGWRRETDQLQTLRDRQARSYRQRYERQQRERQASERDS